MLRFFTYLFVSFGKSKFTESSTRVNFVNRKVKKLFNFNFFYHVVLHSLYSIKLLWYLSSVFNSLVRCTYTIIIPPQLESVSHNTLNSNVYIHESGKTK